MFRPISYYGMNNEKLAKAHLATRREYGDFNYITKLPIAETARFHFFVTLEDTGGTYTETDLISKDSFTNCHQKELRAELDKIFGDEREPPESLRREVQTWYHNYMGKTRNNYYLNKNKDLNEHIKKGLFSVALYYIFINKVYWKEEMKLTDGDKLLLKNFFLYNYNTLTQREADMIKKPEINDFQHYSQEEMDVYLEEKKMEEKRKEVEMLAEEMIKQKEERESVENLMEE